MGLGTFLAIGGDGDVDQTGVDQLEVLVSQAHAAHDTGRAGFHQHVGPAYQPGEQLPTRRQRWVQGDAPLAGVQEQVEAAALGVRIISREGAKLAGRVPGTRSLDLYRFGPQVRNELGAVGSRYEVGELQDSDSVKSSRHVSLHGRSRV